MDLKALHSLMIRKKFHYFEGKTNDRDDNLYLSFSTKHNGRGDFIGLRIGNADNDVNLSVGILCCQMKNIKSSEVLLMIENIPS